MKAFLKGQSQMSSLLKGDNICTVGYMDHLGGTRSQTLMRIEEAVAVVPTER